MQKDPDLGVLEALVVGKHSHFLRFLLDPSENHGLGDYFLKSLLKRRLARTAGQAVSAIDVDVADLSDVVVERERWNIDLLVHSEDSRLVFAFEKKIDSTEHSDQLRRYREIVDREFLGFRRVLIYLTPDGEESSDPEQWLALSYEMLRQELHSVINARRTTLTPAVVVALEQYGTMIGRHIVRDSEISKLCQRIYRQHRAALELIFEHRPDLQMELKSLLEEEIGQHDGFGLDHCTKSRVRFFPLEWDADSRQKMGTGWTPTRRIVLFELVNDPESLKLTLVVGPSVGDQEAASRFREAIFAVSQTHRAAFMGSTGSLYPRWTRIFSKELVKKKDFQETENVPDRAREALRLSLKNEVPRVITDLREVFRSNGPQNSTSDSG